MAHMGSILLVLAFLGSVIAFPADLSNSKNATLVSHGQLLRKRVHSSKNATISSRNHTQSENRTARQVDGLGPIGDALLKSVLPAVVEQMLPVIAKMASQAAMQAGPLMANMMRDSADPQLNGGALDIGSLINALLSGFADPQRSAATAKPTPPPSTTTTENPFSGFFRTMFQE